MRNLSRALTMLLALLFSACSGGDSSSFTDTASIYGELAEGAVPSQLDAEMLIGLSEPTGYAWMAESGVPWNARYTYLSPGWADNWGWGAFDGSYAFNYMTQSEDMNALPVFDFYLLNNIGTGGTQGLYAKTQDPATMQSYFDQFKLLLSQAVEFGKPVLVLVEADGFAFLQIQTDNDPTAYAAIADSGVPELAELPNTITGWGLAFLELKQKLGADNVVLGMHVAAWAGYKDIAYVRMQTEICS